MSKPKAMLKSFTVDCHLPNKVLINGVAYVEKSAIMEQIIDIAGIMIKDWRDGRDGDDVFALWANDLSEALSKAQKDTTIDR